MVRSLFSLLVALAWFVPCAFADVLTLAPITLQLGDEQEVADAPAGSEGSIANTDVVSVDAANKRKLEANGVGSAKVEFKDRAGTVVATVDVTVAKIVPVVTLNGKPLSLSGEAVVFSGATLPLKVQMQKSDGSLADIPGTTAITPANPDLIDVVDGTKLQVKTQTHTDMIDPPVPAARVDLDFPGDQTTPLNFLVAEPPASITVELPLRVQEESTTPIHVKVKGSGEGIYQSTSSQFAKLYAYTCVEDSNNPVATMSADGRGVMVSKIATSESRLRVKCNVSAIDRSVSKVNFKDVVAFQSGGRILLTPNTLSLFSGQNSKVTAQLVGRDGREINKGVDFSVDGGVEGIVLAAQGDRAVIVTASKDKSKIPASGLLNVTAKAVTDDGSELTASLPVSIVNASGFTRVRGGLEMLDYETAKDLYGSRTAEDFYVAKITLLNDLGGDLAGASILVFSSSLGIGVNLQKAKFLSTKMRKRHVNDLVKRGEWKPIAYRDLRKLGLPINYPLTMEDVPHATQPGFPRFDIDDHIVYTCDDVWYAEQSVDAFQLTPEEAARPDREKVIQEKKRQRDERVVAARLRQLRYRPYPYDMVIKSFDPRDNRTGRSLTFRALTFAGSVAAFLTGVPNFGASEQFIAVNDKVTSVLIPGLAAFWPSMRETQRQNLIDDTMHPIEEIPYGSSLTKMIFLPKYPFQGLEADHWFRISEICPFDFQVEVAISHKEKQMVPVSPIAGN